MEESCHEGGHIEWKSHVMKVDTSNGSHVMKVDTSNGRVMS